MLHKKLPNRSSYLRYLYFIQDGLIDPTMQVRCRARLNLWQATPIFHPLRNEIRKKEIYLSFWKMSRAETLFSFSEIIISVNQTFGMISFKRPRYKHHAREVTSTIHNYSSSRSGNLGTRTYRCMKPWLYQAPVSNHNIFCRYFVILISVLFLICGEK